jgi:hypothetical protein
MDATPGLKDESFRRSLAETIAWCGTQEVVATVEESEDIKKRRILGQQGGELTHRAFMERGRFWNRILRRHYTNTRLWRQGMELYRQANLSSISPLLEQLRNPTLRPNGSLAEARTEPVRDEIVRSVIVRRSEFVRGRELSPDENAGKLLVYAPEENLADGAAQLESKGFFDGDNVPPWNTWVAFSHGILLSWIPPQFVGLAQNGIDVNPECCIRWMD